MTILCTPLQVLRSRWMRGVVLKSLSYETLYASDIAFIKSSSMSLGLWTLTNRLCGSRPRNENTAASAADALVDPFVKDTIERFSTLLTRYPSRLMLRLEGRLLHRSITHWQSALRLHKGPSKNFSSK